MFNGLNTATRNENVSCYKVVPRPPQDDGPGPSHGCNCVRLRSSVKKKRDTRPRNCRYSRKGRKSGGKVGGGKSARDVSFRQKRSFQLKVWNLC